MKTNERADLVETFPAAGAGIDVEQVKNGVGHDFEDVGMAADEEAGVFGGQDLFDPGGVLSRIAADMGEKDFHPFTGEMQVFGEALPQGAAVDISINRPQGFEGLQLIGYLYRTDIAGMPHFVAFGEMRKNGWMEVAVGVGEQSNSLHKRELRITRIQIF